MEHRSLVNSFRIAFSFVLRNVHKTLLFFSDINNDLALFDAPKPFQLSHDLQNQALLKFKFLQPGFHKVIIHLVDQKTKKLVCAWMLRATCQLPTVSKEYDVDISKGHTNSKKLLFTNQCDERKRFNLISSNEKLMIPKNNFIEINEKEIEYIRLQLFSVNKIGTFEVYLFVNDDGDQVKECFLLRLHVKDL
uniref:Uncharacterized protein n=1 Tax=Ditylum brightwellii TaxID=49249 RepID=A0A7S4RCI7_9STRA